MKRTLLTTAALLLPLVSARTLPAQQPDAAHEHQHEQSPMPMQEMMPMMMEMHERHSAMASAWTATKDGVFIVRAGQLMKYDESLKLVKAVDLPNEDAEAEAEADQQDATDQATMRQKMQQRMARMHGSLPVRIEVTDDALFVSLGETLLKYNHQLALQAQAKLPPAKAMRCPMCEMMMKRMKEKSQEDEGHAAGRHRNGAN